MQKPKPAPPFVSRVLALILGAAVVASVVVLVGPRVIRLVDVAMGIALLGAIACLGAAAFMTAGYFVMCGRWPWQ